MISPIYAANNMIRRAKEQDLKITNLKLQKLLYFLYTRYLFDTKTPLFSNRFEAWQYGPVLTEIYDIFKIEGANPIVDLRPDANGKILVVSEEGAFGESFDRVWARYARMSAANLVALAHGEENADYITAWRKTVRDRGIGALMHDEDIMLDGEEWFGRRNY